MPCRASSGPLRSSSRRASCRRRRPRTPHPPQCASIWATTTRSPWRRSTRSSWRRACSCHSSLVPLVVGALGVVCGDLGTSPLYSTRAAFEGSSHRLAVDRINVMGAVSITVWTLVVIIGVKYVWLVLRADNQGEGGILVLTALVASRSPSAAARRAKAAGSAAEVVVAAAGIGDAHGPGVEHRLFALGRPPPRQVAASEPLPVGVGMLAAQPVDDPCPGVGASLAEGALGHPRGGSSWSSPAARVEPAQKSGQRMMIGPVRRHRRRQRRYVGVHVDPPTPPSHGRVAHSGDRPDRRSARPIRQRRLCQ